MGELSLIAAIERVLSPGATGHERWIGDDAAVVEAKPFAVNSIDTICEGVHFELSTHSPSDVGHKALAVALSDLAAMGAMPGQAYVSLALPSRIAEAEALELMRGASALATETSTAIAGGDVVRCNELVITIAVVGWTDDRNALVYRDGARAGDLVAVTGTLGDSGAGLLVLQNRAPKAQNKAYVPLIERQRRPTPRLRAGQKLAQAGASAMIDLSDGLATDARHIAERSGVQVRIALEHLPISQAASEVARAAGFQPHAFAATAGDDYELLVTAPPRARRAIETACSSARAPLTWVGEVTSGEGLRLERSDGTATELSGYEHLAR